MYLSKFPAITSLENCFKREIISINKISIDTSDIVLFPDRHKIQNGGVSHNKVFSLQFYHLIHCQIEKSER